MKLWQAAPLVLVIIILLLLFIPTRLEFVYDRNEKEGKTFLVLKYGFLKFRLIPKKKKKEKTKDSEQSEKETLSFEERKNKLERYIQLFEMLKSDVIKILDYASERAAVFENVTVLSEFGFENAMHTGIFTGILNGFVYSVLGLLHNHSRLEDMKVNLQPVFGKICFNSHISCILRIKNVHIIVIAFNVLKIIRIIKKGSN